MHSHGSRENSGLSACSGGASFSSTLPGVSRRLGRKGGPHTIRAVISDQINMANSSFPAMFTNRCQARSGGVLARSGRTMRRLIWRVWAGFKPAGVICSDSSKKTAPSHCLPTSGAARWRQGLKFFGGEPNLVSIGATRVWLREWQKRSSHASRRQIPGDRLRRNRPSTVPNIWR